jgi:lipopolysaccharide transport system permease protein
MLDHVENAVPDFDRQAYRKLQQQKAVQDFFKGLTLWPIWLMMAWQDIYLRYRRSLIGPLWITLSMAITVYSMGFLYAHLWHVELKDYFPFLTTGMLCWALISIMITEGTDVYLQSVSLIRQIKLPYTLYIHRMTMRNFMIFGHNLLVMLPIYIWFYQDFKPSFAYLMFLPGLVLLYANAILYGNILGLACARYRDLGQIVKSLIQVMFFMTPIMWKVSTLPNKYQAYVFLNPFFNFVEIIREPLLGIYPDLRSYVFVGLATVVGIILNALLFVRYRSRIVYWL